MAKWLFTSELGASRLPFGEIAVGRRSPATTTAAPSALDRHLELAAARSLVERYGEDSIAPYILRPDKSHEFVAGGVLAYRLFGRTAVVSGDPVGPPDAAARVLESFLETARSHGWRVVFYGVSARHLDAYHRLGLRSICAGEEAVVRPESFSLEGRQVRKLRQSVHRVRRRGWQISAHDGVGIDTQTEAEINALELQWRAAHPQIVGFAMSMGRFQRAIHPSDLYVLARSPEGTLAAAMRFIACRGKLSLDTMRRLGETPNGLNEALVCRALEVARDHGIPEVSLNYAGLAHLVRGRCGGGWLKRAGAKLLVAALSGHFQMERLVRFDEKFSPDWRPRYLVYPSRRAFPGAVYRVLQAEGYVPLRQSVQQRHAQLPAPPAMWLPTSADAAGL